MTRRELEDLLYQLCPEQKKRKQKEVAELSIFDEKNIINMMLDFKTDDWQEFLEKMAFYLKRYNVVGSNGINISLPSLIQQALFYVCFMCKFEELRIEKVCLGQSQKQTRDKYYIPIPKKIGKREKTFFSEKGYDLANDGCVTLKGQKVGIMYRKFADKDIINFLEIYDINLSHNFFSRLKYRSVEKYYKEFRAIGHELTEQEIDYIRNDVEIMSRALKIMFDLGLTKMTIGSCALHNYKDTIKNFRIYYPELPIELDTDMRKSYKGGFK